MSRSKSRIKSECQERRQEIGLSLQGEIRRGMLECIDRFYEELFTWSNAMNKIAELFKAVSPSSLIDDTEDQLKISVKALCSFYDEVSEIDLLLEIPRLRRHLRAAKYNLENIKNPPVGSDQKKWTALDFLMFIVEWDFVESLPNLTLSLKLFLTICVSVASCKRSFSGLQRPQTPQLVDSGTSRHLWGWHQNIFIVTPRVTPILVMPLSTTTIIAYGVVVSMFDFHRSDRGSNPCCGSKIS